MRSGVHARTMLCLRPLWLSLLLILVTVLVVASSVSIARWVPDSSPILNMLWTGAVTGILLSLTRWPGRWGIVYSLVTAAAFSLQELGQVAPSLWTWHQQPAGEIVWNMHLRALALGERISGWIVTLQAGENITDTGLFVLLTGFMLWNAVTWLVWCILRRMRPLEGLLPLGFLLAANIYLSGQALSLTQPGFTNMWFFILAGLLLVIHSAHQAARRDWDTRQVDYPDDIGDWIGSALIVLVMLGLFIRLSPVVGSREGWQSIATWIERYRARAAEASERLFSEVRRPAIDSLALAASLPDLETIGAPVPNADQTVMWVRTSDPAPPPPEAPAQLPSPPRHYWRSRISGAYTGSGWTPVPLQQEVPPINLDGEAPPGRYRLEQEFDIVAAHDGALFAVNFPAATGAGVTLVAAQGDGSTLVAGEASRYTVISLATRVTASALRHAGTDYPPAIVADFLQLPANLPERVRSMAARLARAHDTPFQKAIAVQDYLRMNYPYNENVPPPPPGRDAVDYFLYEAQEGFCTYHASAMVVLLRAEGVPARVVSGFSTGAYDYERRAFRVAARNAHAWVEVYFPGYGWVEFEPTPAFPPRIFPEGLAELAYLPLDAAVTPEPDETGNGRGVIQLAAVILAVLLAIILLRNWDRWQNRRSASSRTRAILLYWQIRRSLAYAGLAMTPSTTPAEFLHQSTFSLAPRQGLWEALNQATELYQQAAFSRREPSLLSVLTAHRAWQRALPQWLLLWAAAGWKRLTKPKTAST
ncbi:MAG TPA: transglutaminase domain-containing protein [Levilinea sp.]|nr:transglutaminase domain-containing protein [Levilinea sp.]